MDVPVDVSSKEVSSFTPPFKARDHEGILAELSLTNSPHRRLMEPLAFGVEIGHYPRLDEMNKICASHLEQAGLAGDSVVIKALNRFEEAARLGLFYEQLHGPGSARNASHPFWPNVWERDKRLRALGYKIDAGRVMKTTRSPSTI